MLYDVRSARKGVVENQRVAGAVRDVNFIPKEDVQQRWKADNRIPQIDGGNRQIVENKEDESNPEVRMQIHGPDEGKKVAYFEPKSAKPDHPLVANVQPANVNSAKKLELNVPHAEQVAPPRVDDADDQNQQRNAGDNLADRLKRGAKVRHNAIEAFDHPANPVVPVAAVGMAQRHDIGFAAAAGAAGRDSRIFRARDEAEDILKNDGGVVVGGVVEKPLQIVEPQLHQDEEDQGPGMRNEHNANVKEDAGDEGEGNDEDYQYEDGRRDKVVKKDSVNGPHAAPVDEDEEGKEGGLR